MLVRPCPARKQLSKTMSLFFINWITFGAMQFTTKFIIHVNKVPVKTYNSAHCLMFGRYTNYTLTFCFNRSSNFMVWKKIWICDDNGWHLMRYIFTWIPLDNSMLLLTGAVLHLVTELWGLTGEITSYWVNELIVTVNWARVLLSALTYCPICCNLVNATTEIWNKGENWCHIAGEILIF